MAPEIWQACQQHFISMECNYKIAYHNIVMHDLRKIETGKKITGLEINTLNHKKIQTYRTDVF